MPRVLGKGEGIGVTGRRSSLRRRNGLPRAGPTAHRGSPSRRLERLGDPLGCETPTTVEWMRGSRVENCSAAVCSGTSTPHRPPPCTAASCMSGRSPYAYFVGRGAGPFASRPPPYSAAFRTPSPVSVARSMRPVGRAVEQREPVVGEHDVEHPGLHDAARRRRGAARRGRSSRRALGLQLAEGRDRPVGASAASTPMRSASCRCRSGTRSTPSRSRLSASDARTRRPE